MGKLVSLAVVIISAVCTTISCHLMVSNKWVVNERQENEIETHLNTLGFFRQCIEYSGRSTITCDNYNAWVFSGSFPSWIIAGRIFVFCSAILGFFSTIAFLLGSDISTVYAKHDNKKKVLKRSASFGILISAVLLLICAIWTFISVVQHYNDGALVANQSGQFGGSMSYITGSATYICMVTAIFWVVTAGLAIFGTKNQNRREE